MHATAGVTARILLALVLALARPVSGLAADPPIRIGVVRSADVPVFNRVQKGFEDALASSGYRNGVDVVFDIETTNGQAEKEQAIARKFKADEVALIHSIGTRPTQGLVKADTRIPVVFSAVTDPVSAGIVPPGSKPGKPGGGDLTGVTDAWPVHLQLDLFSKIAPQARVWGTIYNPAESNSVFFLKELRASAGRLGLELIEVTVTDSSQVKAAAASLAGRVNALFNPADNTVTAGSKGLIEACDANQIALFTGGSGAARGALASYGIDYYLVGYAAGKKASLVLKGSEPGAIPWGSVDKFTLIINLRAARAQGMTIPPEMLQMADRVIN